MTHTYYGCALKSRKPRRYGILKITKRDEERSQQEWTSEEFRTWDEVVTRMNTLNQELLGYDVVGVDRVVWR